MTFLQTHTDNRFTSILVNNTQLLLAAGTILLTALASPFMDHKACQGAFMAATGDPHDTGLQMTAPPLVCPDGTIFVTGQNPSDQTYYVYQLKNVPLPSLPPS